VIQEVTPVEMSDRNVAPDTRLATYGTLLPGRANNHQLAGLSGRWRRGTVRGRLADQGWGASLGYPGLVLDPSGPPVEVDIFESPDLPAHWSRLDAFEGTGYRRVIAEVSTTDGDIAAWVYVIAEDELKRESQ